MVVFVFFFFPMKVISVNYDLSPAGLLSFSLQQVNIYRSPCKKKTCSKSIGFIFPVEFNSSISSSFSPVHFGHTDINNKTKICNDVILEGRSSIIVLRPFSSQLTVSSFLVENRAATGTDREGYKCGRKWLEYFWFWLSKSTCICMHCLGLCNVLGYMGLSGLTLYVAANMHFTQNNVCLLWTFATQYHSGIFLLGHKFVVFWWTANCIEKPDHWHCPFYEALVPWGHINRYLSSPIWYNLRPRSTIIHVLLPTCQDTCLLFEFSLNYTKLATLSTKTYARKSKINSVKNACSGDRTQDLLWYTLIARLNGYTTVNSKSETKGDFNRTWHLCPSHHLENHTSSR